MNWAIVGQVAENRTLLGAARRDIDLQREQFLFEQRRTDERLNNHQKTVTEFMLLLREQLVLMKQILETKNKP